jgi:hypothetical protein
MWYGPRIALAMRCDEGLIWCNNYACITSVTFLLPVNKVDVPHWLEGFPSDQQSTSLRGRCTLLIGRVSFQLARYMYLINRKETLPINEVHLPQQPDGNPSAQQGRCTLLIGRVACQSTRYMYLIDWKESLPVKSQYGGGTRVPPLFFQKTGTRHCWAGAGGIRYLAKGTDEWSLDCSITSKPLIFMELGLYNKIHTFYNVGNNFRI